MLGTLNGALEVRQVSLPADAIRAEVEGVNHVVERIPTLASIHVHYVLKIPAGKREVVDRALSTHQDKCPTAQSLKGCVEIAWSADIEEG